MADELNVSTYEQIVELLTNLATNYSNIASLFYTIFYDENPQEVTFQMYDKSGTLKDYKVKNLALSNAYRTTGTVIPEGTIEGAKGTLYQDLTNGEVYIKQSDEGNQNWKQLVNKALLDGYIMQGLVDPNGILSNGEYIGAISATPGTLYVDTKTTTLYIRLSVEEEGKFWKVISANVGGFALVNLSNVSVLEENTSKPFTNFVGSILADRTASEISSESDDKFPTAKAVYEYVTTTISSATEAISSTVAALVETKQDKSNLVTSISSLSTDTTYPSAKCMYDLIGNLEDIINAL